MVLNVYLSGAPQITLGFSGVCVNQSLFVCVCFVDRCLAFCTFFFWPLCSLFFFDLRILITPLISSDSSYEKSNTTGGTSCAGTANTSGIPAFIPCVSEVRVKHTLVFLCGVLYIIIVLFVLVFWQFNCLFFNLRLLITPLGSSNFSSCI